MLNRRDSHLPFRWLVDLHDGVLDARRSAEARQHLDDGCARCGARARRVARLVAAVTAGPLPAPREADVSRALATFRAQRGHCRRPGRGVLVGALVFDQRVQRAAAVRSALGERRRLLFRVEDHEIDAAVVTGPGGLDVEGEVLGPDDLVERSVRGHVELRVRATDGERVLRCALRRDGRFSLRDVPRGTAVLSGEVDGLRFVLPGVVLD